LPNIRLITFKHLFAFEWLFNTSMLTAMDNLQSVHNLYLLTFIICRYGREMLKFSFISANHTSLTFVMMKVPRLPC